MFSPVPGIIFDIRKYSIQDGPGIRTVVFLKGCPLSCWWCHNPESQSPGVEMVVRAGRCILCGACVDACPEDAISWESDQPVTNWELCERCGTCTTVCYADAREQVGRWVTVAQVIAEIERDIPFYDESKGGLTISGGEPLAQPAFCLELLKACKELDVHTALDTSGFASWNVMDRIRPYVDLFLYDLKLMDSTRHREVTGVPNEVILKNLRRLSEFGCRIHLRLPIIPGINDDEHNIQQLGRFAASLPKIERIDLLPYHHIHVEKYARLGRPYPLENAVPLPGSRMDEIAEALRSFGLPVAPV